jgi:hypothetical protein
MRDWTRAHGLSCSQSRFTVGSLNLSGALKFPELKAKAHNCKALIQYSNGTRVQGHLQFINLAWSSCNRDPEKAIKLIF